MGFISKIFGKGEAPSEEYIEIDMNRDIGKKAKIGDDGLIYVSDVFGESIKGQEYFKFDKPDVNTDAVLETLNEVKLYALADKLKQMAVEVFGLEPEMVYGTNKQKNQKTRFLWQDMPGMDLNYKATYSGESGKKNKRRRETP